MAAAVCVLLVASLVAGVQALEEEAVCATGECLEPWLAAE